MSESWTVFGNCLKILRMANGFIKPCYNTAHYILISMGATKPLLLLKCEDGFHSFGNWTLCEREDGMTWRRDSIYEYRVLRVARPEIPPRLLRPKEGTLHGQTRIRHPGPLTV